MCEDPLYELEDDDEERLRSYAESAAEEKRLRDYIEAHDSIPGVGLGRASESGPVHSPGKNLYSEKKPRTEAQKQAWNTLSFKKPDNYYSPMTQQHMQKFAPKPEPNAEHMNMLDNPTEPLESLGNINLPRDADTGTGHLYGKATPTEIVYVGDGKVLVRPDPNYPLRLCQLDIDEFPREEWKRLKLLRED